MTNVCTLDCRIGCNVAHARIALEQKIIRATVRALKSAGWIVTAVHDGQERIVTLTEKDILEVVFSVDESTVHLSNGTDTSWFLVVLGNGIDCIPDYGSRLPDDVIMDVYERFE